MFVDYRFGYKFKKEEKVKDLESWNDMLDEVFQETGDNMNCLILQMEDISSDKEITKEMDRKFDSSFGITEGTPFIAWSENWIYFPFEYDGKESIAYVPRHPNTKFIPKHFGD